MIGIYNEIILNIYIYISVFGCLILIIYISRCRQLILDLNNEKGLELATTKTTTSLIRILTCLDIRGSIYCIFI